MAKRGPKPRRTEIIWTSEFAYGIGLMASDGCMSSNGRNFEFVSKDIEQVENLRKCFGITTKISRKRSGRKEEIPPYYHVQWGDKVLYDFFLRIGLTPRKSLSIGALEIPDEYFFDFLRGSYDGDGCFYSYFDKRWKNSFMFYLTFISASIDHIIWLQKTIERLCNVKGHITRTGKEGKTLMSNLKYAKKETLIVLQKMYQSPAGICLARKRLKIVSALRIVNLSADFLERI
jgi:hypothetical protein